MIVLFIILWNLALGHYKVVVFKEGAAKVKLMVCTCGGLNIETRLVALISINRGASYDKFSLTLSDEVKFRTPR